MSPASTTSRPRDAPSVETSAATDTAVPAEAEVRFFFTGNRLVSEDMVTGSFNASVAQWLMTDSLAPRDYVAAQGTCIGCEGRVHLSMDDAGQVWAGGDAVTCISGMVNL